LGEALVVSHRRGLSVSQAACEIACYGVIE
jgi:hypothetical protein